MCPRNCCSDPSTQEVAVAFLGEDTPCACALDAFAGAAGNMGEMGEIESVDLGDTGEIGEMEPNDSGCEAQLPDSEDDSEAGDGGE